MFSLFQGSSSVPLFRVFISFQMHFFLGILKVRNELIGCSAFLSCLGIVGNENYYYDDDATAEDFFYGFLRIHFYGFFERFCSFYFVYFHGYKM